MAKLAKRCLGLVAAVAVHVFLLIALVATLRPVPITPTTPAIDVSLVRLLPPVPKAPSRRRPTGTPTQAPNAAPARTAPTTPAQPSPPAPPITGPSSDTGGETLRRALRRSVGCAHPDMVGLSAQEREDCRLSAAAAHQAGPTYAVLPADPAKAASFERAARLNDAMRTYHNYVWAPYPGIHCVLLGDKISQASHLPACP